MCKENVHPYDSNRAARFEEIMREWDYEKNGELRPEQFTPGSKKKVWWKCKNSGMSWEATIANRMHGRGCPYDAGQRPIPDKTDLAMSRKKAAGEWNDAVNGSLHPDHFMDGQRICGETTKTGDIIC